MEDFVSRAPARRRRDSRYSVRRTGRKGESLSKADRLRLIRLGCSLLIFLVVFGSGKLMPERMGALREDLGRLITNDMDFRAALETVGEAVTEGDSVWEVLGRMYVGVFQSGGAAAEGTEIPSETEDRSLLPEAAGYDEERRRIAASGGLPGLFAEGEHSAAASPPESESGLFSGAAEEPEAPSYDGPALPEGVSMERVPLLFSYTTPLSGQITSPYGWREHPTEGGTKFHYGVDIAAEHGADIAAFADGTVEYTGQSTIYGLYLRIKHPDDTTTFYAHCSKILVSAGSKVTMGQRVALVGDSGNAAGAHLHFELRHEEVYLNPIYYFSPQ